MYPPSFPSPLQSVQPPPPPPLPSPPQMLDPQPTQVTNFIIALTALGFGPAHQKVSAGPFPKKYKKDTTSQHRLAARTQQKHRLNDTASAQQDSSYLSYPSSPPPPAPPPPHPPHTGPPPRVHRAYNPRRGCAQPVQSCRHSRDGGDGGACPGRQGWARERG
ncbi:hypothetical protein O988_07953 [Pseudogymnoascus sp. VKM F-3808]|nr:hypothetical protein O988_07953 [Pseudogymnoascus sp. VKM F-3808]